MATEQQEVIQRKKFFKCCKRSGKTSSVDPGLTNQPKKLWILLGILLALIVLAVLAVGVYLLFFRPEPNHDLETVEELKKYMNLSADPCVDFYNYACGGWFESDSYKNRTEPIPLIPFMKANVKKEILGLLRQPVEEDDPPYSTTPRKYFAACKNTERLNERGITPFLKFIKTIGKFPLFDSSWKKEDFNFQDMITKLTLLGIEAAFKIKGSMYNKTLGHFYKMECSVPSWNMKNADLKNWYQNVIELLGFPTDSLVKNSDLAQMFIFEDKIKPCQYETKTPMVYGKTYADRFEQLNLSNPEHIFLSLQAVESGMSFSKLLRNVTAVLQESEEEDVNTRITEVMDVNCIRCTLVELSSPDNTMKAANYLMKLLLPFTSALNTSFPDSPFTNIVSPPAKREERCYNETIGHFPEQVWRMYMNAFFHKETASFVKEMVSDIREVINQSIEETILLKPNYGETHNETLPVMNVSVGLPEYLLDDHFLNNISIAAGPVIEYFEYIVAKSRYDFIQRLGRDSSDRYSYGFTTQFWNRWTRINLGPDKETLGPLLFPVATLKSPVFNPKWRSSMKYGALGYIIAGFMFKNAKGEIMSHDYIDQFRNFVDDCFTYKSNDEKVHVFRSKDHMFPASALKTSFQAYRRSADRNQRNEESKLKGLELNQDQLFFLSYAQMLCRPRKDLSDLEVDKHGHHKQAISVLGPLQNSVEFAEAYQCPPESPMNLRRKCPFL